MNLMWKSYLYISPKTQAPLLIRAKQRPSPKRMPRSGTWVVREWCGDRWCIPCFPEIVWEKIKTLIFIGRVK